MVGHICVGVWIRGWRRLCLISEKHLPNHPYPAIVRSDYSLGCVCVCVFVCVFCLLCGVCCVCCGGRCVFVFVCVCVCLFVFVCVRTCILPLSYLTFSL